MVWQLFVDESGDFNDPGDTCVVAGILVNAPPLGRDATVRAALEAAYPGASYPFHSSAVRFSSGRVHATLVADPRRTTGGAAERELAARARAFFATRAKDDDASALLASIEERREPEHSVFRACDRLLYHHDAVLAGHLKTLTTNDTDRMHQVFSGAWKHYGAKTADGVFVAAAVDAHGSANDEVDDPVINRDRYLALLQQLLQRVGTLLCNRATTVWITAAQRAVTRNDLGRARLMPQNIGTAGQTALSFPLLAQTPAKQRLRFLSVSTPDFNANVPPGVVLADFASNRIRDSVRGAASRPWYKLRGLIHDHVRLNPTSEARFVSPAETLSSIADVGPSQTAIWNAFSGDLVPAPPPDIALWSREQARAWIEAGRAWRAARGIS